ncbi:MAG: hypothetical protein M3405_17510 [Acidobacteriota bacterium]|nr:hypothetical protein [Acidobacteriota bacterium]
MFYIYEYHRENLIRGKAPNDSWQKYEYDTAGRLIYVRDDTGWIQQSNEYASSRQRLASGSYASVDITYYAWGGSSVLAEYSTQFSSSSLAWQKSYVYAGSRLLSTITNTSGNEVTEYHHPDRLGTRLISNPVTATQSEQLTLPFGTLIGAETSATNDKRFTSYDRSEVAGGLDYAVNRNYNSGQSRFTQVDPIGMASASIGNPQSMNLFAYVQNNPIDFVDPSGLQLVSIGGNTYYCEDDRWDESTATLYAGGGCYLIGGIGGGGGGGYVGGDYVGGGGGYGGDYNPFQSASWLSFIAWGNGGRSVSVQYLGGQISGTHVEVIVLDGEY